MNATLTADYLRRRALVYVRQSTAGQVLHNVESQERQYALATQAQALGFQDVVVIDDDLGRSGSGLIERPGFQRLVADVCTGHVGAVEADFADVGGLAECRCPEECHACAVVASLPATCACPSQMTLRAAEPSSIRSFRARVEG